MTSERGLRDIARAIPGRIRKTPRERAVAGEGELTAGRPLRSLEDDPAHRLGESGMADAVEHDLRDRLFALGVVARLVEHRSGEAIERAGAIGVGVGARQAEGFRGRVGIGRERHRGVDRSEEHTSELLSLLHSLYAVLRMKRQLTRY